MKPSQKILHSLLAMAVLSIALACSGDDEESFEFGSASGGGGTNDAPSYVGSSAPVAQRMEVPAVLPGNTLISHWSVEKGDSVMSFCLEYDYSKYHSRWVAFRFDKLTRAKNVARKDYSIKPQYPIDPYLTTETALESDALYGSGYNHGHLCASADRLYSRTANDNTFFMTNMSPQIGSFNSDYWSVLEKFVQNKGRDAAFSDTLYVVKGGTITTDKILGYVAAKRMPIPKYYFMALLKVKNGAYTSIGFWMEHKEYNVSKPTASTMMTHALSIDALEELTGINFFHNLPDNVETTCEALCTPSAWGMK